MTSAHQPPQIAHANGIDICYEIFGDAASEPLLLIMGLGAQMIHWDDDFCRQLAARGFRVIRFDNRDIGKSSHLSGGKRLTPFELVKLRSSRDNLWVQIHGTNTFKQVGGDRQEVDERSTVAGWDDRVVFAQRVRNYTAKPIDVEIRRSFGGHAVFRSALEAKNHDYQTVEYAAKVAPGAKAELKYELLTHQGRNAKQADVPIEGAEIK